jgi:glycolate oxidase FAD binding subunit
VLPRPEAAATLLIGGVAPTDAVRLVGAALGSPHEVSGAAYLPAGLPAKGILAGTVALRLEGPSPSVSFRRDALLQEHAGAAKADVLADADSGPLWRAIGEAAPLLSVEGRAVWRVSVAPARGAEVAQAIAGQLDAEWFLDWGGGLLWVAAPQSGDAGAAAIRAAIRGGDGHGTGHATLVRGSPALRRAIPVFEPQPPALAALSRRVKEAFDPAHILNPGRMVEGS